MPRITIVIVGLALALCLSGCGLVYKQNVQQGNVLDDEDIAQLEEGMTKRQVLVLLGSPSVQSPFHADRWDYVSTFARRGTDPTRRHLMLEFENDRLVAYSGSYLEQGELSDEAREAMRSMEGEAEDLPVPPETGRERDPVPEPVPDS